jgi:prepilin-type N-terminal cleavage/methylation domain-containing protein
VFKIHKIKFDKGFTLIELLVVVAIISLLSAIVFASLNSARAKAKDAAIKEEVSQFANLMTLNYSDYGDYCNLSRSVWVNLDGTCSSLFTTGTYATQAQQICSNIVSNAAELGWGAPGAYKLYSGTGLGCATTYSIMVPLNNGKIFCSGSSGAKGAYAAYSNYADGHDVPPNGTPGCVWQP